MASLLDFVGNTPLVEIKNIHQDPKVKIFAKLEGHNPGGSVKDRAAFSMIKGALERNEINTDTKLIEPTSGNTGIALAMIARLYHLNIELVMPENATAERVKTMRAYGATVTLTPAEGSMEAAIDYARQKVENEGYFMLNQFGNPDNYMAHYRSTGPEIWRDTEGQITHFVSAMGTTGTIMGTSRFLKEKNNVIQIVGTQPKEGARIPGIRRWPEAYLPAIFERERVDQIIDVSQEEAEKNARRLAYEEGIFSGASSGGAFTAALKVAAQIEEGVIVFIVCDRGDRYLSSSLFS